MRFPEFLQRVEGRTTGEDKGIFNCRSHDDAKASCTCQLGRDGRILVKCQVGCPTEDVVAAFGLKMSDLFPENGKANGHHNGRGIVVATYDYVDESGDLLYQVVRMAPKDFRQRRRFDGAWAWGITAGWYTQGRDGDWSKQKGTPSAADRQLPDVRRVLYHLPQILAAPADTIVFIVEGEKDVDNLAKIGIVATTNLGGAGKGKWRKEYTMTLRGRRVVCLPDNDDAGHGHMRMVASCGGAGIVELPGLSEKGDVSDWIAAGGTAEELLALVESAQPSAPVIAEITDEKLTRPLASRSYFSIVTIVESNRRNVLEGRRLGMNEMTGQPTLSGVQVRDEDAFRIRYLVEARFEGEAQGRGMRFGLEDVRQALLQVAATNRYHPVRDYLNGLHWDGRERIRYLADLLGADRSEINQAILRRWMVSAVARPMNPGCKVDTMLVLVGDQGIFKSTFFHELASPWFVDTAIDVHIKDAFGILSKAWILEWAELETIHRARDAAAVKSFITSATDTFRRPYGHFDIETPRTGVIVGTTNNEHFLSDETGARRFWPVRVTGVDVAAVQEQRDQLWAEAVSLYRAREQWWLTEPELAPLGETHDRHAVMDAWEPIILRWATDRVVPFTTGDILGDALDKKRGEWTRGDEMRVAAVLRRDGWRCNRPHRGSRVWSKPNGS